MTVPLNQVNLGAVTQPYVHARPFAQFLWLVINLASFAFEFKQWRQRRAEATKADSGSFALLMTGTAFGLFLLVSLRRWRRVPRSGRPQERSSSGWSCSSPGSACDGGRR
jgi:hypothetical protein